MALVAARRRALAVALAAVLIATLTAGGCQPEETPQAEEPAPDVSYAELPPAPTGSEDPHNRQNVVPVPKGTSPRAVEFADPDTGYALFSSCVAGQACEVGLVLTLDGGSSWVARKLPFDDATEVDMRLGRGNVLILKAAPTGWFISRDTGRTFQQRPMEPAPVELNLTEPRYQASCPEVGASECPARQLTQVADDGTRTAITDKPPGNHAFTSIAVTEDNRMWVSSKTTDGTAPTISVWYSSDGGKHWVADGSVRPLDPTADPKLVVDPSGTAVWLVGGRFAARRNGAGSWTEATAMRELSEVYSAEVLPRGRVLVATGQGVWLVDLEQKVRDTAARTIFRLRRLGQTTVLGYPAQQSGEVWLCSVEEKDGKCDWSRVAVTAR
ncbi:sialidase family protein [Dactylosporangium sp. NPDC005572]|uniref:sialidase family protein n=1 Tax=Dactylosporangium sp. NPDC005572 TaxID=3156889 RepID=UPI0033BF4FD9